MKRINKPVNISLEAWSEAIKKYSEESENRNSELYKEQEKQAKRLALYNELVEALKSVKTLNLHLLDKDTIGGRVYKEVMNALDKAREIEEL